MARTITSGMATAIASQASEIVHLLEMEFDAGTVRFTTGPHDVSVDPNNLYAVRIGATISRYLIRNPVLTWPTTAFTLEMWWRRDVGDVQTFRTAFSYSRQTVQFNEIILANNNSTGVVQVQIAGVGPAAAPTIADDGLYHHVVVTWNSSGGALKFYVDGVLVTTTTLQSGYSIVAGGIVVIGQEQDAAGGNFDANQAWLGEVDDVRLYSRVLTGTEVTDHMNGTFTDETGLVGLWTFNNPSAIGNDSSPIGNHLTPVGITAGTTDTHAVKAWSAAGGAMSFEGLSETPDASGQRLKLTLDGVSLGAISALLAQNYVGRIARLYRAHIDSNGAFVADPLLLFLGFMNSPWDVSEDWDNHWAKVETELVSPLAVTQQIRGITADENSHQAQFAGDTFFSRIATKPTGDFGWGVGSLEHVTGRRDPRSGR